MSWSLLQAMFDQFALTLGHVLPYLLGMGLVFGLLSHLSPCNAGKPWWQKRGLATDLCYWFAVPLFTRYMRIWVTVLFTIWLFHISDGNAIAAFYLHGHGALSRMPLWLQVIFYLGFTDLALYWIHRGFHEGFLWKYHAVHHASKDVEWISAARFHPLNLALGTVAVDVGLLLAGVSPDIFIFMGPFSTITSMFVHANLDWTLGPFKYVFAGPVFHRWHHARGAEGKNFAGTFPFIDLMFGTFHMPQGQLPGDYGIDASRFFL